MRRLPFVLALSFTLLQAGAQIRQNPAAREESPLTGNARIDLFRPSAEARGGLFQDQGMQQAPPRKSPWLAAGMSLVVPGAGEFYAERYLKSAVFLAVEVGVWALAYHFDRKGD